MLKLRPVTTIAGRQTIRVMLNSVRRAAIRGIHWRAIQFGLGLLIHLVSLSVLARLLTPLEYGVYAFGMVFFELLAIPTQMGLGASVVWSRAVEQGALNALLGLSLLLSVIGAVAMVAVGLARQDSLNTVLYLLSLALFFRGIATVPEGVLNRDLRFSVLAKIELLSDLVFAVVAISCASIGYGELSLAIATAVQQAVRGTVIYIMVMPTPSFDQWRAVAPLIRYGAWTSTSRALSGLGRTGDSWVLGYIAGNHALGLYNRAVRLGRLPGDLAQGVLGSVLFPSFSALRGDARDSRKALLFSFCLLFFLTAPMAGAVFMLAPELIRVLLGNQWLEAIPALQVLAAMTVLNPVAKVADDFLRSGNELPFLNLVYGIYAALVVALGVAGASVSGTIGVAAAVVLANIVRAAMLTWKAAVLTDAGIAISLSVLVPGVVSFLTIVIGLTLLHMSSYMLLVGASIYLVSSIVLCSLLLFGSAIFCPGHYAATIRGQVQRAIGGFAR